MPSVQHARVREPVPVPRFATGAPAPDSPDINVRNANDSASTRGVLKPPMAEPSTDDRTTSLVLHPRDDTINDSRLRRRDLA